MSEVKEIKERRQKWIDALRSGDYQQTTYCLESNKSKSFCCLGVACKVAESFGVVPASDIYNERGKLEGKYWPKVVREWFGFDKREGVLSTLEGQEYNDLVELNDKGKLSFDAIADLLQKENKLLTV